MPKNLHFFRCFISRYVSEENTEEISRKLHQCHVDLKSLKKWSLVLELDELNKRDLSSEDRSQSCLRKVLLCYGRSKHAYLLRIFQETLSEEICDTAIAEILHFEITTGDTTPVVTKSPRVISRQKIQVGSNAKIGEVKKDLLAQIKQLHNEDRLWDDVKDLFPSWQVAEKTPNEFAIGSKILSTKVEPADDLYLIKLAKKLDAEMQAKNIKG